MHGYWDIDIATLVATSIDDLPRMIAQLEKAIAATMDDGRFGPAEESFPDE